MAAKIRQKIKQDITDPLRASKIPVTSSLSFRPGSLVERTGRSRGIHYGFAGRIRLLDRFPLLSVVDFFYLIKYWQLGKSLRPGRDI